MERNSRLSGMRRSSILKLGFNRDDETNTTGFLFNKSQGQSRRVSFAATAEVKEFPRDSPRVWRSDSEEDNEKENVPQQNKAGGVSITGLDSLIHGQIDPQSYESITECPIPEMSADSFNLCIGNETVREPLDMETTQCVEPAEFDWPRFQSEPSTEIRIAESSFLASLRRQTKCLSPLQIYRSPKDRPRSLSSPSSGQDYMENDNDKSTIMMTLQFNETSCKPADSPQYKPVDSKSFLSGLLGSKSMGGSHQMEFDESLCIENLPQSDRTVYFTETDKFNEMDETHCHGAILNNSHMVQSVNEIGMDVSISNESFHKSDRTVHFTERFQGMDETNCHGAILDNSQIGQSNNGDDMDQSLCTQSLPQPNRTVYFTESDKLNGMDETTCHGAILNNSQIGQISIRNKSYVDYKTEQGNSSAIDSNKTVHGDFIQGIEETACIGGILSNTDKENVVPKSLNSTHLSQFSGYERTRYFGENAPLEMMEETQNVGAILNSDLTNQITAGNTITNIRESDKTKFFVDQEDCLNETRCVESVTQEMSDKPCQRSLDRTIYFSSNNAGNVVEETACIGGIMKNNPATSNYQSINQKQVQCDESDNNKTNYFTENNRSFAINETRCEGGILYQASVSEMLDKSRHRRSISSQDKTKYFNDMTINIEETNCLGGIEMETKGNDQFVERETDQNKTRHFGKYNEEARIEETQCVDATIHLDSTAPPAQANLDGIVRHELKENKADSNKTEHFGSHSELARLEETQCAEARIHMCNATTSEQKKVRDGTVGHDNNVPEVSSLSADKHDENSDKVINMDVANQQQLHKTIIASVSMEETNVGGVILSDDISIEEDPKLNQTYNDIRKETGSVNKIFDVEKQESDSTVLTSSVNCKPERRVLTTRESDLIVTSKSNFSSEGEKDKEIDSPWHQVFPDITDSEITFKAINKRTLSDLKSKEPEPEKTRDLTQTDSYTRKMKELLIMSAQKTAPQIKAGMIKTPSKSLTGANQTSGTSSTTSSPAHKRIRLFESQSDNSAEKTHGLDVQVVEGMMDTDLELGIDDETMPDGMRDVVSVYDTCNETVSQHNTTRGTSDSGTTSTQSLTNTSLFSNRSLLYKAPDGPLTLDTFFKLTAKPPSGYKIAGRCSTLMPKKSIEYLDEKLETEFVDRYLIEEKKKIYERVTDKLQKNEENLDWLKKTIEETQPQIFQDVAKGNRDEVNAISEELLTMYNCCSKEGSIIWKRDRTKMFETTIEKIETEGMQKAKSLLKMVRTQNKETDDLLAAIDQEIEELERSHLLLVELEGRKNKLEKDLKDACRNFERDSVVERELKKKVEENQQKRKLQEIRTTLRSSISQQLFLVGWNLEDFNEDGIGFAFLDEEFLLTIYLKKDSNKSKIQGIELESRLEPGCPSLHKRIAHSLLLKSVDRQHFLQKYKDFASLPQALNEISSTVSEINRMCREVEEINCKHKLSWDGQMLSFELWNTETLKMVRLSIDLVSQLSRRSEGSDLNVLVKRHLGNVSVEDIQNSLTSITPGSRYLHRIIQKAELELS